MIEITDEEYKLISDYIIYNYGINLGEKKKTLVKGRLQNLLAEKNIDSFSEYYNYLIADKSGKAVTELVNRITTNYTYFMRETQHYDFLKNVALPYFTKTVGEKELRIWSAGCSSGEEPYNIGMVVQEYIKETNRYFNAKILATDISDKALQSAKNAEYLNSSICTLPKSWQVDYFNRIDDNKSVVDNKVRSMVRLGYFNLMENKFPFKKKFHVIFCRNVMIYFDAKTKDELVNKYYDALMPGGYLFIGHSEALNRDKTKFKYIKPAIYRKEI